MQTFKASDLFNEMKSFLNNTDFESSKNINIDFSGIESVDLKAVKTLMALQKIAVLNNKTLSLSNMNGNVQNMLDITGFNKTFDNLATNPVISRR